jgi:hypothetical protein
MHMNMLHVHGCRKDTDTDTDTDINVDMELISNCYWTGEVACYHAKFLNCVYSTLKS